MADFQWTDLIPVASSLVSYGIQSNAADKAAAAQQAAAQQGINAYSPYTQLGASSVQQMRNLLGLGTQADQQSAIDAIKNSSEYQTLLKQGENSILANAAATGGLRGGNTQSALAQFSPTLLNNLINQKISTYGSLANSGQNAVGSVANLYNQQGSAQSGSDLADANALTGLLSNIGKFGAYQGWWGGDNSSNIPEGTATQDEVNLLF